MDQWKYLALGAAAVLAAMRVWEAAVLLRPGSCSGWMTWIWIFLALYLGFGWFSGGRIWLVCAADLFLTYGILAVIDGKMRIVPGKILLLYLAAQLILGIFMKTPPGLLETLLKGAAASLLAVTAMTAGWQYTAELFFLALFLSLLYSLYLLLVKKKDMKTEFPFVPFLAAAAAFQAVWGIL